MHVIDADKKHGMIMKLIEKDALVAEMERRISQFHSEKSKEDASVSDKLSLGGRIASIEEFKVFINTLEVKEEFKIGETEIYLNDDGGEPPYYGKQWLDLSCTEYEIPSDKFKDGDNVEIIIRKAQKGE